jgi:hypothetical protein
VTSIIRVLIGLAVAVVLDTTAVEAALANQQQEALAPAPQRESDEKLEKLAAEAERKRLEQSRLTPLSVDVVVSRFQGEKKISSLPYTLAVNANGYSGGAGGGQALLRMGANVPVPSIVAPKDNPAGPAGPMPGPVNYQDIGTSIDCSAQRMEDGSIQLRISIQDTSVYTNIQDKTTPTVGEMPVFRKFSTTNMLVMKDGQSREFTAATDRVSGEVVRIAVTLRVVK